MVTHESQIRATEEQYRRNTSRLSPEQFHDPAKAKLPPYYPDTPVVRKDWARYYDNITAMDYQVAGSAQTARRRWAVERDDCLFLGRSRAWIAARETECLRFRSSRSADCSLAGADQTWQFE
jgi:hypothetical protein